MCMKPHLITHILDVQWQQLCHCTWIIGSNVAKFINCDLYNNYSNSGLNVFATTWGGKNDHRTVSFLWTEALRIFKRAAEVWVFCSSSCWYSCMIKTWGSPVCPSSTGNLCVFIIEAEIWCNEVSAVQWLSGWFRASEFNLNSVTQ